jgi:hypothetical protein
MAKKKSKVVVQVRPAKGKAKKAKTSEKEVGLLGQALRALGTSAGGAIGGYFGNPVAGAGAGHGLGAAISRWLGAGDYSVASNSIVGSVRASGSIPSMHSTGQSVVVRHKEFVMTVRGSTNFTLQRSMPINPGRAEVFPWLSRLANCYQEYRIRGMVFHYVPTSGNVSGGATPSLGSVMLQTSYRSNDSAPTSKLEMLNEYWSTEVVPYETACHPIECNPSENPFNVQYVRSDDAALPVSDSPLLYDLATTHVATEGQTTDGAAIGDLWVTYEVELKKPILSSNVTSSPAGFGYMRAQSTAVTNLFVGTPFGTSKPYTLPWTTGQANDIIVPPNWAGTAHVVISLTGPLTGPKALGAPTVVGDGSVVNWSLDQDRYEFNSDITAVVSSIKYCFAFVKKSATGVLTVTIPTPTRQSTGLLLVEITVFGKRNHL